MPPRGSRIWSGGVAGGGMNVDCPVHIARGERSAGAKPHGPLVRSVARPRST